MTEQTPEILSDEALKEIETRPVEEERDRLEPFVSLSVAERAALCQTVRALKAILNDPKKWMQWCDHHVLEENESLRDQLAQANRRHVDAEEDLASAQLRIDELKSRLAQVEDELNTARAALAKLALEQTQP